MNTPILPVVCRPSLLLAFALALASVSCGSNSSSPSDAGATGSSDGTVSGATPLPCDVNAVVVAKCQICHSNPPISGAPMPLVTWEDFQVPTPVDTLGPPVAAGTHVYQTAEARIHNTQSPMPQLGAPKLTAAEMATMDTWLNAGAPKTDSASCVGLDDASVPDGAVAAASCSTNNVAIKSASPWTMPADPDVYTCYSVSIPATGTGTNHILGITPNIDNKKIVHHVLLFQADANDGSITSTPAPCNAGGSLTWRIVYGWAPGGTPMQTPPDVGFPYDASTKWVVQIHYNNASGTNTGQTDQSGFSFCSTDQPIKYDADVIAFGTQNIQIPPNSSLDQTCSITIPSAFAGIHTFASFPHMHQLGNAIQTEQVLPSGGIVTMGENIPWNFQTQLWFPIETTLNLGDVVKTRCAWTNTTASQVTFGQNTENEMCYSFTSYYPKITSGTWSWALPALTSTCAPSPTGGLPTPDAGWEIDGSFGAYSDAGTD